MLTRRRWLAAAFALALLSLAVTAPAAGARSRDLPLTRVRDVPLPGRSTRFDYQSIDAASRRLYVAHLGDATLDAVDLDTLTVTRTVRDLPKAHGVLAVPELGRVFVSATGINELVTLDATTDEVIGRTPTGAFPDGIAYDQRDDLVLVSNKNDGSESIIEGHSGRAVRTVELGREIGNVAYDSNTGLAYVAVRPPDELVAIEPATGSVMTRMRLRACRGAHGVYVPAQTQQAFVACERNAAVATVDLAQGKQVAADSVGKNPDVLAYDPANGRLYVAAESGVVTVFSTESGRLRKLGQAHLADSAHSVAVDPTTQLVYFPLERDPKKPGIRVMRPVEVQR
ncbi:MAG: YncE family protein [Acidimicrobiia bacterium]